MLDKFKLFGCIAFLMFPLFMISQEVYQIRWNYEQQVDLGYNRATNYIQAPGTGTYVMIGGLNNLDGSGNFFRLFGAKMIIDDINLNTDGTHQVVIRREDGLDIFDMFPTLNATLIPARLANTFDGVDTYSTE